MTSETITIDNQDLIDKLRSSGQLIGVASGLSENPIGNTGFFCHNLQTENLLPESQADSSPRFTSRVHWLQGTFNYRDYVSLKIFTQKLEQLFSDTFEWDCGPFTRGLKFQDSAKSSHGIYLAWIRPTDYKPGFAWISIPGAALDRLLTSDGDETAITMLFHLLDTGIPGAYADHTILWGWKTTRIDTAVDDHEKKIRPSDLIPIAEAGNYSGFRHKPVFDARSGTWLPPSYSFQQSAACDEDGNVVPAGTIYFGSSQSNKTLYIYDKYLESSGKVDSVRWEARWRDEYAHERFKKICACLFDSDIVIPLANLIASITTSAIDFIHRDSADRVSRCKRYDFWKEIINQLGRIKLALPIVITKIEATVEWIEHQVETSFAILEKVCGFEDFINAILRLRDRGLQRLGKDHRRIIEQAIKDGYNLHEHLDNIFKKRSSFTDKKAQQIC